MAIILINLCVKNLGDFTLEFFFGKAGKFLSAPTIFSCTGACMGPPLIVECYTFIEKYQPSRNFVSPWEIEDHT